MSGKKDLTVTISPCSDKARSLLPEVIDQLESLVRFLRSLTDEDTTFEVVSINQNSPLTAVIRSLRKTKAVTPDRFGNRPVVLRSYGVTTDRAAKTFTALAADKKLPPYADSYALTQLRELADDLGKTDHFATIIANDEPYTVDDQLKRQIDDSLGGTRIAYASFTGELSRLNARGSRWSFTIFPPSGPSRLLCYFDPKDIGKVRSLVTEVVTVRGPAVYAANKPWPISLRVEFIDPRKPASEGLWSELPSILRDHYESASEDDKELLDLVADLA